MSKKTNGYIKWVFVGLAIAGIIWNAATLHNDVKHLQNEIKQLKADMKAEFVEVKELIRRRN